MHPIHFHLKIFFVYSVHVWMDLRNFCYESLYMYRYLMTWGFILGKFIFITPTIIFWKLDSPVPIKYVFFKLSGLFINSKSMHVGFSGFIKHIGSFIRFCILQILQNFFKVESSMHELKWIYTLERQFRCDSILPCLGL